MRHRQNDEGVILAFVRHEVWKSINENPASLGTNWRACRWVPPQKADGAFDFCGE
jgi:hypothetical protein